MLDISKPLTSGKVQSYYRSEYAAASNSYFSQGGTLEGQWHGKLAAEVGLQGAVNQESFDRLAEGKDPFSGEQLIRHRDTIKTENKDEIGHRAGWDLTFNAPKTISLTALVGEDERVRQAHQEAVKVALNETEKYVQARLGGLNPPETTGKWIAATFEHDTARPVNGYSAPHLHTHVIAFNMTEDAKGQARSLDPHELFRVQSMATAVYQNHLEYELRKLGYGIERGLNHAPDIKGYSPEYLAAESLRTAEIKQGMEERGVVGREAESYVKHQNREEKLKLTPDELRQLHRENAERFGNQPAKVVTEASEKQARDLSPERIEQKAQSAITFAKERLGERSAVFEHFEVVRDALRHTQGKATLQDVYSELRHQKEQGRFMEVSHVRPSAPASRYTTPELVAIERETIERVRFGQATMQPVARLTDAEITARYSHLNDDQRRVIRETLSTADQVLALQGKAGTGKTTALAAIKEYAEVSGYQTHGLGPTSRAAKGLKEAGIEAETLQMYLTRTQEPSEKPRLFFVDESSLASGKQMRDFLARLQPQDRVLLIGDTRQHQSVEAGRIFAELQDAGMGVARLEKIVRQKDEGLKQAVEAMAAGRIQDGVKLMAEQGRIHQEPQRERRFEAIARAYAESPQGTLVVSPDNKSRKEINAAIREELREKWQLKADVYQLNVLVTRQDLTGEDRKVASSYHQGDSIRYLRGSETLGLEAKSYSTVIETYSDRNEITVRTAAGKFQTYNPERLSGVTVYEQETRAFAVGERVQFTAPWKDKGIANRDMGTVEYLDKHGNISVRMDDSGRSVAWNLNGNKHVDYAYTMTSHSSQGATVDRVLIQIDTGDSKTRKLINEQLAYVATSRPRYDAQLFTDNAEKLGQALSRTNENTTALAPEQVQELAQRQNYQIQSSIGMAI
jgi:conjugative relaxase-like TrwC/TraI family protein